MNSSARSELIISKKKMSLFNSSYLQDFFGLIFIFDSKSIMRFLLTIFLKVGFFALAFQRFLWMMLFPLLGNPYKIDSSCQNYNGVDIRGDIEQAVREVHQMAVNALNVGFYPDGRVDDMLIFLFGNNRTRHNIVKNLFQTVVNSVFDQEYTLICDDKMVHLVSKPGFANGYWQNTIHNWGASFEKFRPCNGGSMLGGNRGATALFLDAYTVDWFLIYLCPKTLDHSAGRSLNSYKDRLLTKQPIAHFYTLPGVLFHEFLHTKVAFRKFSFG